MDDPFFSGKTACCFTGHRPDGLPHEASAAMTLLRLALVHAVQDAAAGGVTRFYCGGATGFDTLAAEAVIAVRGDCPDIKLMLALPSETFFAGRSRGERLRAEAILRAADGAYYASADDNSARSMMTRNRYLADHADCCVAYLKKMRGGTLYTVNYAVSRGIPVKNLAMNIPS